MPKELDPTELEIKLQAVYDEWRKTFSYYVDFKSHQLTMPSGVKVRHESSWSIGAYGYPSLLYSRRLFHVWDHSEITDNEYREVLDALALLAEHVAGDEDMRNAARTEMIREKTEEVNDKISKLEQELKALNDLASIWR